MQQVEIQPWVVTDVSTALGPTGRLILDRVLFDLNNHLPNNLARYQSARIHGNPGCFWYGRVYASAGKVYGFSFVVRDVDPAVLKVIWVVPTA